MFAGFIEQYFGAANDGLVDNEARARPVVIVSSQTDGVVFRAAGLLFYRRNRLSVERPPCRC